MAQIIAPNLDTQDGAGWCLRFVSKAYGINTDRYGSATQAANASQIRTDSLPSDVSIPVWFHHWGIYGTPPTYGDWGHVMIHVPGRGLFGSPLNGYGNIWLPDIATAEKQFRATYRGWSLDLAGTPVASTTTTTFRSKKMAQVYGTKDNNGMLYALAGDGMGKGAWIDTRNGQLAGDWVVRMYPEGKEAIIVSLDDWVRLRDAYQSAQPVTGGGSSATVTIDYDKLAKTVFDEQARRLQS